MLKRIVRVFLIATVLAPCGLHADDEGQTQYQANNYQASYDSYRQQLQESDKHRDKLDYGAGTAAYKNGDYYAAAEHLGQAILSEDRMLQAKSYYNLGNTFYQLGKGSEDQEEIKTHWQNAITHYQEAEKLGSDLANRAVHNREIVERKLEQLNQQEQQDGDQQEGQGDQNQNQKEQEGGDQQEQDQQEGQEDGDQQEQEQDQQEGQDGDQQDQDQDQDQQEGQDGDQNQEGQKGEQQDEGDQQQQSGEEGEKSGGDQSIEEQELKEGEGEEKPKGDVRAMDQGAESQKGSDQQEVSAYELTPDGKLSEAAARALLQSLESEEVKIRPRSKSRHRVLRDW